MRQGVASARRRRIPISGEAGLDPEARDKVKLFLRKTTVIDPIDRPRRPPTSCSHTLDQAREAALDHRRSIEKQFLAIFAGEGRRRADDIGCWRAAPPERQRMSFGHVPAVDSAVKPKPGHDVVRLWEAS